MPLEQSSTLYCGRRITLVFAWWGRGLTPQPGAPGTGPARQLPREKPPAWLHDFATLESDLHQTAKQVPENIVKGTGRACTNQRQAWEAVPAVSPAWMPLAALKDPNALPAAVLHRAGKMEVLGFRRRDDPAGSGFEVADARCRSTCLPLPPLRFFLRAADEIGRVYVPRELAF